MGRRTCRILGDQHVCQRLGCWREWNRHPFTSNRWVWNIFSAAQKHVSQWDPECSHFLSVGSEENGLRHFEIDSKNGDIRTTQLFSQRTEPFYTLKITARDAGAPSLEDTAVVHIQVPSMHHNLCVCVLWLFAVPAVHPFIISCSIRGRIAEATA